MHQCKKRKINEDMKVLMIKKTNHSYTNNSKSMTTRKQYGTRERRKTFKNYTRNSNKHTYIHTQGTHIH